MYLFFLLQRRCVEVGDLLDGWVPSLFFSTCILTEGQAQRRPSHLHISSQQCCKKHNPHLYIYVNIYIDRTPPPPPPKTTIQKSHKSTYIHMSSPPPSNPSTNSTIPYPTAPPSPLRDTAPPHHATFLHAPLHSNSSSRERKCGV